MRLVRSELLKLRTTRLLLWLALLLLGLALLVISLNGAQNSADDLAREGTQRSLVSFAAVSALLSLILGIVSAAGEYTHGTAAHTFLVAPVRERVMGAKLVAVALAGAALAIFAGALTYGLAALWISARSVPSHLGSRDTWVVLLGTIAAAAIAGAVGVGFGSVVRRQTAAIVVALVWLLVGEPLLAIAGIQRYAPGHAIAAVVEAGQQGEDLLAFWPGLGVALAYVAVLAVVGALAVKRADVA